MTSNTQHDWQHHLYSFISSFHVQIFDFIFDKDVHAQWCSQVLNVDKEIKAHLIQRTICHDGPNLCM